MNESVYALIPDPVVVPERPPRHVSKFNVTTVGVPQPNYSTFPAKAARPLPRGADTSHSKFFEAPAAPMGRVVADEIDPKRFLKKGGGVHFETPAAPREARQMLKAALVPKDDKPVMGLHTDKDFVRANAVEVVNSAPKGRKVPPPPPTASATFGKPPPYLAEVKAQLAAEKDFVATLHARREADNAAVRAEYVRPMPEEERAALVAELRQRWDERQRQLQQMPLARDTMMQIARKEAVEKELKEIEAALARLDKKVVYVYKDAGPASQWAKATACAEAQAAAIKAATAAAAK